MAYQSHYRTRLAPPADTCQILRWQAERTNKDGPRQRISDGTEVGRKMGLTLYVALITPPLRPR